MTDRHDLNAGEVPAPWSGGAGDVQHPPPGNAVQLAGQADNSAVQHWQLAEDMVDGSAAIRWGRLGRAFRRYWWILVVTLGLGVVGSAAMWHVMSPVYLAEGALWMEVDDQARDNVGPIASGNLLQAQAWVDLLTSFAVLDSVVLKERLHIRPKDEADAAALASLSVDSAYSPGSYVLNVSGDGDYELTDLRGYTLETGRIGQPIGASYGINWRPTRTDLGGEDQIEFTLVTLRDASASLSQQLEARMDERGSFIRIRLTGTNPEKITSILNTLMDRHVTLAARLKRARLDERVGIVADQLEDVERDLANAEGSLEEFRTRTITLPSDRATPIAPGLQMTRDPVFSNFNQMRVELENIRTDKDRIRRALSEIPASGVSIESLEMIDAVASSTQLSGALTSLSELRAQLRTALYRYTPDHPSVVELQDHVDKLERETIPFVAEELIASLERRESDMEDRIADASAELSAIPSRTIREGQLQRSVELSSTVYGDLSRRFEIATLEARSSLPDVRLLDPATVPDVPDHDLRPRLAAMALLLGLVLGIGIVVVLDQTDRRVRDPQQVASDFGLSILGMVPRLNATATNGDAAPVVEAFREIRLNTAYAYGAAGPMVFSVSSPAPQEGKSFVAANLAIAFAGFGRKTLLIDGDTRRGNLHRLFAKERKPGLVDFLEGEAPSDGVIQPTDFEGLELVTSGQRSELSPELLGSKAMHEFIAAARTRYDVIIVDSPPLTAGTDAFLLSTLTRHLALVIRSGSTDKALLQAKLAPLHRLPVRILGAVLNDANGSAYRYYTNYLPGYEATSENGMSHRLSDRTAVPGQVVVEE